MFEVGVFAVCPSRSGKKEGGEKEDFHQSGCLALFATRGLQMMMTTALKILTLKAARHWVVNLILRIVSSNGVSGER